ncbi:MAG: carbonic anhydrase [Candidatus Micrarchaeota archaeon]
MNAQTFKRLDRDYKNPRKFEVIAKLPITDDLLKRAYNHPSVFPSELTYLLHLNQTEAKRGGGHSREMPVKVVAIFCCDSRSEPRVYMKNQAFKERTAVLRIAGNVAADDILNSLDKFKYKNEKHNSEPPIVIIFGHTTCGLVKAAFETSGNGSGSHSENINLLIKSAHIGHSADIHAAEIANLNYQAQLINSVTKLHTVSIMTNVTTATLEITSILNGEYMEPEILARKVVNNILQQNRELKDDLDLMGRAIATNHTQKADIVQLSDGRNGYQIESVSQLAFVSSIHGKSDYSPQTIGSLEYKFGHVDGRKTIVADSHYPDVNAANLDQVQKAGLITPDSSIFTLQSDHGIYTPVVTKDVVTGKIYGASLLQAMDVLTRG